jgi:hypothetical protein
MKVEVHDFERDDVEEVEEPKDELDDEENDPFSLQREMWGGFIGVLPRGRSIVVLRMHLRGTSFWRSFIGRMGIF